MKKKEAQERLIQAFQKWRNISDACFFAAISRQNFYNWLKTDKKFAAKIWFSRSNLERNSKDLIYDTIIEKKDISLAKRYLEKRTKEDIFGNNLYFLFEETIKKDKNILEDIEPI